MTTLSYRGYQANVTYEKGRLLIEVLHLRDTLLAECVSAADAEKTFRELVDEYIEDCKALGRNADRPFRGQFSVRVTPEIHKSIAAAAAKEGCSLNAWVCSTLEAAVNKPAQTLTDAILMQAFTRLPKKSSEDWSPKIFPYQDRQPTDLVAIGYRHGVSRMVSNEIPWHKSRH